MIHHDVPRPSEEVDARRELTELVEGDPSRTAMEKETSFNILGDEKFIRVHTAKPTIVKSLLEHDFAVILSLTGRMTDGAWNEWRPERDGWDSMGLERIHTLSAHMPIGVLTIKGSPRSSDAHSNIVNTPAMVQQAREAFSDD